MRNLPVLKKTILQLLAVPASMLLGYLFSQVFFAIFALGPLGTEDVRFTGLLRYAIVPGIFAISFVALSANIAPVLKLESAIAAAGLVVMLDALGAVRAAYLGVFRSDMAVQSFSASACAIIVAVVLAKKMGKPPPVHSNP